MASQIEPPQELVQFVSRQDRDTPKEAPAERRSMQRRRLIVKVLAQPIDEDYNPIGEPMPVVSRDISPKGIGLVHTEPIESERLALEMQLGDQMVKLVGAVKWCGPCGPFYYIGCQFVGKLNRVIN